MGYVDRFFDISKGKVDAAVFFSDSNRFYFSGYHSSFGIVFLLPSRGYFITDSRYADEVRAVISQDFEVITSDKTGAFDIIKQFIEDNGVKILGYEDATLLHSEYLSLTSIFGGVKFVGVSDVVGLMRAVKSEDELTKIRQAAQISDKALLSVQKSIKLGVTEREIRNELEYQMRLLGADGPAFDSIVAFGAHTAVPHAHCGEKKLEKGDFILIDFGARVGSYCSDMTRTMSFGEPSSKLKALYSSVQFAQKYALSGIKAGLTGKEVDSFAREYLRARGLGEYFTHGCGHGLGLDIHEFPSLSKTSEDMLEENMVITCEPGVYVKGLGGVRIEDTVIVKKDGVEILNSVTKELIIL